MEFAEHILIIDGDHGYRRVECKGDENSYCWQFEDEMNDIKKGQECYIAYVFNEGYGRVVGSVEVPIDIEGWDEDGLWAHLTGRPIVVERKVFIRRRGIIMKDLPEERKEAIWKKRTES